MAHPLVFKAEVADGVADLVRKAGVVTLASAVKLVDDPSRADKAGRVKALAMTWAKGSLTDFDLHAVDTILATTGWNNNDDVFDPLEVWAARHTPEHKQLNVGHDDAKIVGHIVTSQVVDADLKPVDEATAADDLPAKFHVLTGGVLYTSWRTPELQEQMDTLLASIAKGEMFVSMECLFKGFDYALKGKDGTTRVVARNEKTAFLTKHLRAYGGTGQYGSERVGRLMRNIVFSGKGLVSNPANPESVILNPQTESFASARATVLNDFVPLSAERVYLPTSGETNSATQTQKEKPPMTVTLESVQAELAAAKAEIARLTNVEHDKVVAELKAKVEVAEAAKKTAEDNLKAATDVAAAAKTEAEKALAALNTQVEDLTKKLSDAETARTEAATRLAAIEAEKTTAERVATVKEKLKLDDEKAKAYVAARASLDADGFAKDVEFLATAFATSLPAGTPAPLPPKSTDKPAGPKSTGNPAPMAGAKASEDDAAGEQAAETTDIDTAQAADAAALQTVPAADGVTDMQKAIASYLGRDLADTE